jgi:hypothetical protein
MEQKKLYDPGKDPIALIITASFILFIILGLMASRPSSNCIENNTFEYNQYSAEFYDDGTFLQMSFLMGDTVKYTGGWRLKEQELSTSIGWSSNGTGIFKVMKYQVECDKLIKDDLTLYLKE